MVGVCTCTDEQQENQQKGLEIEKSRLELTSTNGQIDPAMIFYHAFYDFSLFSASSPGSFASCPEKSR